MLIVDYASIENEPNLIVHRTFQSFVIKALNLLSNCNSKILPRFIETIKRNYFCSTRNRPKSGCRSKKVRGTRDILTVGHKCSKPLRKCFPDKELKALATDVFRVHMTVFPRVGHLRTCQSDRLIICGNLDIG